MIFKYLFFILIFCITRVAAAGADFSLSVINNTQEPLETTVHTHQCMVDTGDRSISNINNISIQPTQTYTAQLEEVNSGDCYVGYVCIGTKFFAVNIWGQQGNNIGQIVYKNDCSSVCYSMSVHTADPAHYAIGLSDNCDSNTDSPNFSVTVTKNP